MNRCLKPLPCIEHHVSDHLVGSLLYGNAFLSTPSGPASVLAGEWAEVRQ